MTTDEIYGRMRASFAARSGMEPDDSSDVAVRLYAAAAQLEALSLQADWVKRQCFPQTAEGAWLDYHAAMRGLERKSAARACGTLRFSVTEALAADVTIEAGTVCLNSGLVRFETTAAAVLPAGSLFVDAAARAAEAGLAGNTGANTITVLTAAPVGVAACTNPAAFSGGAAAEDDEALRARVLATYRRLPNGANAAYYEREALNFDGVAAVEVLPRNRGVGTVDVVIAAADGLPSSALLAQVQAHFDRCREIAVDVGVIAPTAVSVAVTAAVTVADGYAAADVLTAVEDAAAGWFSGERLGRDVLRAELISVLFAVEGVANIALTAPQADVTVGSGALAVAGTVTVTEAE